MRYARSVGKVLIVSDPAWADKVTQAVVPPHESAFLIVDADERIVEPGDYCPGC
jgi:hypothetical protein